MLKDAETYSKGSYIITVYNFINSIIKLCENEIINTGLRYLEDLLNADDGSRDLHTQSNSKI